MTIPAPAITVLMPVFNAAKDLREAIDSILTQTERNFEFLIIDDGSTDSTAEILSTYTDPRIRRMQNPVNLGLVASLNIGISLARGTYLARMDADDISLPDRLKHQLAFIEQEQADIVGCHFEIMDAQGKQMQTVDVPLTADAFTACLANTVPFAHGSVMLRLAFLQRHSLSYGPNPFAEDYDLWTRMYACGAKMINIPLVLFRYRDYGSSLSKMKGAEYACSSKDLRRQFVHQNVASCSSALMRLVQADTLLSHTEQVNTINLAYRLYQQNGYTQGLMSLVLRTSLRAKLHGIYRLIRA